MADCHIVDLHPGQERVPPNPSALPDTRSKHWSPRWRRILGLWLRYLRPEMGVQPHHWHHSRLWHGRSGQPQFRCHWHIRCALVCRGGWKPAGRLFDIPGIPTGDTSVLAHGVVDFLVAGPGVCDLGCVAAIGEFNLPTDGHEMRSE